MTESNAEQRNDAASTSHAASNVRYRIVLVSIFAAFILYLDRVCLAEIVKSDQFLSDTGLDKEQIGRFIGSFFFAYALFQIPAGWLSDRFGARLMLSIYILGWSIATGLTGLMSSLAGLIVARQLCGVMQAGAYPTLSATIRRWIPFQSRGRASSFVSVGGRLGGALAPALTVLVIGSIGGWKETLWLYAAIGIVIAIGYWWTVRDTPDVHPDCNEYEQTLIGHPRGEPRPALRDIAPMIWSCCKSSSLWLNSFVQFCINVGWAFLITWLPTYLKESKGVADTEGAFMVSIVLAIGLLGQPIGGWATDRSVARFGHRFGRVMPIIVSCMIAALAYAGCIVVESAWAVVACCAVVALAVDIGNPSIWAFMQDVGGRNTGAVFGWANMWGNFGASLNAVMVPYLMKQSGDGTGAQPMVFAACAAAFFLAGLAAVGMNATKPLEIGNPVTT